MSQCGKLWTATTQYAVLSLSIVCFCGCASITPANWFPKKTAEPSNPSGGIASTIASTGKGIGGQFKSMGTAVTSAVTKTKNAVTSTFTNGKNDSDPTSLANMPSTNDLGPEIWVTNGQMFETQGKFAKALDNYTKALEAEPQNEAALLSTARLYARQGKHQEAAEFFDKAVAVKPQAATYNELALSLKGQGKAEEAKSAIRQAISLEPSNSRYRNNLAGMLVTQGRSDEAVKELKQVFPEAVANYNVAYLHFRNQNVAAAQQHLQAALQVDPNLAEARELLKQISNSGATKTALAAYETASNIYKTAERQTTENVTANPTVYQFPQANPSATGPTE